MDRLYTKSTTTPLCMISQFNYRIAHTFEVSLGVRTLGQLDEILVRNPGIECMYRVRNIGPKSRLVVLSVLDDYRKNPAAFDLDVADCLVKYIQTAINPRRLDIVLKRVHGMTLSSIARQEGVTGGCIGLYVEAFRESMKPRVGVLVDCMQEAGMAVTEDAVKKLFENGDMALLVWDVVSWLKRAR